ncbi:MAG: Fic family protein [Pseudomonas oryzihabitans]
MSARNPGRHDRRNLAIVESIMPRIESPPAYRETFLAKGMEVMELIPRFKAVDAKGRYLHWHDFKHRVPAGTDRLIAWAATKTSRLAAIKPLSLRGENGQPFLLYLTDYCQTIIWQVEQLNARLGNTTSKDASADDRRYLVDSLMMEEAISSAQLEGAATTRKNAKAMLESEREPRNDAERMVLNNYLLMQAAKAQRDEPLSLELICEFHRLATHGVAADEVHPGELRDNDEIFVGDGEGGVAHQPPPAVQLADRLQALCDFANTAHDGKDGRDFLHPLIKAIVLHFMLGYEHPFVDGNGRTARCLFYWFMLKQGYWAFEYISISSLLKEAPVQYGEAYLRTESDDLDLTYFVLHQLRIVERAIQAFLAYLERRRQEFYELMDWLAESGVGKTLNYRQGHLLKKVLRHPGRIFTVKELTHDYDVSDNTARADLEKLVKLKVLARTREGKHHFYIARSDAAERLKA